MQSLFHQQQFFTLALHQFGHGNAGGAGHDFGDFFGTHLGAQQARALFGRVPVVFAGIGIFQALFQLGQLAVLQLGHFVEVALAFELFHLNAAALDLLFDLRPALGLGFFRFPNVFQIGVFFLQLDDFFFNQGHAFDGRIVLLFAHRFAFNFELNQTPVQLVHHLGLGVDFNFDFGGRFVNQIDRLVGQETIGDVAVRQLGGCHDGRVGDFDAVVHFVFFLQAAQNSDGGFH